MRIAFTVEVELEKTTGKFVAKDNIREELRELLTSITDTLYIDESEYEVTSWEVTDA